MVYDFDGAITINVFVCLLDFYDYGYILGVHRDGAKKGEYGAWMGIIW